MITTTTKEDGIAIERTNPEIKIAKPVNASQNFYQLFLVDDDPMVLKMLSRHFKDFEQFQISTFNTGEACLAALDQNPDIIVLDHNLAEYSANNNMMNGLDVLQKIKEKLPETQVIMLSAQVEVQVAVDCLKQGAVNYVVKDATMQFNVQSAIESIVKSIELKQEINLLSQTIKRDKLLIRGYGFVILALVACLYYFWIN